MEYCLNLFEIINNEHKSIKQYLKIISSTPLDDEAKNNNEKGKWKLEVTDDLQKADFTAIKRKEIMGMVPLKLRIELAKKKQEEYEAKRNEESNAE